MGVSTEIQNIKSAQKNHECSWCAEIIETGTRYSKYRWFDGSDASTVKMHPECLNAMNDLSITEGEAIEFYPGDNPRGCYCNHCKYCEKCKEHKSN